MFNKNKEYEQIKYVVIVGTGIVKAARVEGIEEYAHLERFNTEHEAVNENIKQTFKLYGIGK